MPPPQPHKPGSPGAGPKPPQGGTPGVQAGAEQPGGYVPQGAAGALPDDSAGIIWQLAIWSLNPSDDPDTQALRRAQIRAILLALIDQVAPENGAAMHARAGTLPS